MTTEDERHAELLARIDALTAQVRASSRLTITDGINVGCGIWLLGLILGVVLALLGGGFIGSILSSAGR